MCNNKIGNIFNPDFKLSTENRACPGPYCGGDYGMLHFEDKRFGDLPERLPMDTFVSVVEEVAQGSPVPYPDRKRLLECLKRLQ